MLMLQLIDARTFERWGFVRKADSSLVETNVRDVAHVRGAAGTDV